MDAVPEHIEQVCTDLGLAVMYDIIKQHDGLRRVGSAVGYGATCHIYLPVAPQRLTIVADDKASDPLYGTETLLVAEDEDTMRMLAHTALTRLGYTVLLARDGQEAVQVYAAHRERIALLLLDVIMPRQGGRETYAQICSMGSTVPVLFVTGYSPDLARCALMGCTDAVVLQKPYSIRTLGHKVRELLDRAARLTPMQRAACGIMCLACSACFLRGGGIEKGSA